MTDSNPMRDDLPLSVTHEVRDTCICLYLQRAARAAARRFDRELRPFGLNNGQFSLLMALNRPRPPRMKDLVPVLAMDRTTLTAMLKPLERRGLLRVEPDEGDRRSRRLVITDAGRDALVSALPAWRAVHAELDAAFPGTTLADLRQGLTAIGSGLQGPEG